MAGRLVKTCPQNNVYVDYKGSARRRNIPFELTRDELVEITSQSCYYCGTPPLMKEVKPSGIFIHNGIDRIDNRLGYTKLNCVPCCTLCNNMKHKLTEKIFLEHIKKIWEFSYGGKLYKG